MHVAPPAMEVSVATIQESLRRVDVSASGFGALGISRHDSGELEAGQRPVSIARAHRISRHDSGELEAVALAFGARGHGLYQSPRFRRA